MTAQDPPVRPAPAGAQPPLAWGQIAISGVAVCTLLGVLGAALWVPNQLPCYKVAQGVVILVLLFCWIAGGAAQTWSGRQAVLAFALVVYGLFATGLYGMQAAFLGDVPSVLGLLGAVASLILGACSGLAGRAQRALVWSVMPPATLVMMWASRLRLFVDGSARYDYRGLPYAEWGLQACVCLLPYVVLGSWAARPAQRADRPDPSSAGLPPDQVPVR